MDELGFFCDGHGSWMGCKGWKGVGPREESERKSMYSFGLFSRRFLISEKLANE